MTSAFLQPLLSVAGGTKVYGATVALWRVDFAVGAGEAVAVIGGNGSGKSTLLRVLAGLLELDAGERLFAPAATGSARIALLGHHTHLFDELTIDENLRLFARGRWREVARRRRLLDDLDLADVAQRRARDLSAGTRRRAGLARAIATDPAALLVDEPFASVDARHAVVVRQVLSGVVEGGTVVVVAAHDPGFVADVCPRSVHLVQGRALAAEEARLMSA